MAGIFMAKLENEVIHPPPIFYRRYVDDTYVRKKKNEPDELFQKLNSYHENITFTQEINPKRFLDTEIAFNGSEIHTSVVAKKNKLPPHFDSKIPKRYKRNLINGELHRAKKIATNFPNEINRIKSKFKNCGYPLRFINSVITSFNEPQTVNQEIQEKPRIIINLPFCPENEQYSKTLIHRLDDYTQNNFIFIIVWKTRKIRSLFPLKDRVVYPSDIVYEGLCSCGEGYIGETDRNSISRYNEHENIKKVSEPSKHLKEHTEHKFEWRIISKAPKDKIKRKILEAYFIKTNDPSLNNQQENFKLSLFHNGVT